MKLVLGLLLPTLGLSASVKRDSWGGSVSLGPTKSTIVNAVTTIIPATAPAISSRPRWKAGLTMLGAAQRRASVFGSFGQLDGAASPVSGTDHVRIEYILLDESGDLGATGKMISTFSHKSGPYMRGYGTGTECDGGCTGTVAEQKYLNTKITLASADTTFGNTIASAAGATYSGLSSSEGGKVWTIESITIPPMLSS
ncbi:hypothetical protein CNMCM5793_007766 [Aspergillus hiratsukae]|uniref:Uncharacterized protein n=1 Tax=Aspergillus hiratsukae TaxID=1194566 RepID=A0A8H6UNK3_9EURO|nr:hypothetical protein CNMCM5793_007766 [Aspergillus hiratsukae]KAF7157775.1 hypothetical protein CNMCM6106_003904 [Aspergillus hiratsukae]